MADQNQSGEVPPILDRNNPDVSNLIKSEPVVPRPQPPGTPPAAGPAGPVDNNIDGVRQAEEATPKPLPPVQPTPTPVQPSLPPVQPPVSPTPTPPPAQAQEPAFAPQPALRVPEAPIAPPVNKFNFKRWLGIGLAAVAIAGVVFAGLWIVFRVRQNSAQKATAPVATEEQIEEEKADTSTPQGRDQIRKADLQAIAQALEQYYQDNNQYPVSTTIDRTNDLSGRLNKALVPKYLDKLPIDPLDPGKYYGYKSPTGQEFELTAILEVTSDPEGELDNDLYLYKLTNEQTAKAATTPQASSSPAVSPPPSPATPSTSQSAPAASSSASSSGSSGGQALPVPK